MVRGLLGLPISSVVGVCVFAVGREVGEIGLCTVLGRAMFRAAGAEYLGLYVLCVLCVRFVCVCCVCVCALCALCV